MLYDIEALHNYGNECNRDRGANNGNFLWREGGANTNLPTHETSLICAVKEFYWKKPIAMAEKPKTSKNFKAIINVSTEHFFHHCSIFLSTLFH